MAHPQLSVVLALLMMASWANAAGAQSAPAEAASPEAVRRAALDEALEALSKAGNEEESAKLEARLRQMWLEAGTPAVTLLIARGMRQLQGEAAEEARKDFEAALTLDPDHAEAWHQMAEARYALGDTAGAVVALAEALRREPRLFPALQTLSRIAEERENWKGAYDAWRKAMEIAPKLREGEAKLRDLKRRALGEAL